MLVCWTCGMSDGFSTRMSILSNVGSELRLGCWWVDYLYVGLKTSRGSQMEVARMRAEFCSLRQEFWHQA